MKKRDRTSSTAFLPAKIDELDRALLAAAFHKAHAASADLRMLQAQLEAIQLRHAAAAKDLAELEARHKAKYSLRDNDHIDVDTGAILRAPRS